MAQSSRDRITLNTHRKIYPLDFYRKFLAKNVRPDGRPLTKCRNTSVIPDCITTADGSASVAIGATTVSCGIKLEVAGARPPNTKEGFIEIDVILDPICTAKYHSLKGYEHDCVREEASALSRSLCDIVLQSGMFSLENLCIESDKAVWMLYVDVVCICNDGNLFDACLLAIGSALKSLKLPHTCLGRNDDTVYVDNRNELNFYRLSLHFELLPLTIGVLDGKIIVDPTLDEEGLLTDILHIVINSQGDVIHLHKAGKRDIGLDTLDAMMALTRKRAEQLMTALSKESADDKTEMPEIDFTAHVTSAD